MAAAVTAVEDKAPVEPSPRHRVLTRFARQPAGVIGLILMLAYLVAALRPSWLTSYSPNQTFRTATLASPSRVHWFGTDPIGRDVYTRVIYATSNALKVGILAVIVGVSIGSFTGFIAAYRGGRVGQTIRRFWDGVSARPAVLIGITPAAATGPGIAAIAIAVGIAAGPALARVAYGAGLQQMGVGYVEAAKSLGIRPRRIFFGHLLPNAIGQAALFMGVAVLLEAGLSFLGVGVQPPKPSWGGMLADSQRYIGTAWWYGVFPGLAITGLVLGANMIADAARDALDPRT